jgi:ubiquinone/menaquinone biosynthesis C-methylase UbiE
MEAAMPYTLALVNIGSTPTAHDVESFRPVLEPLGTGLRLRGTSVLASIHSAEHAHRAVVALTRHRSSALASKWQIGVGTTELEAVELAKASDPSSAVIAESMFVALPPASRGPYLAPEEIGGYRACRQMPSGRRCFCVLPIGADDSADRAQSDFVFERLITPACRSLQYFPVHPVREHGQNVWADITNGLLGAELVVAFLGTAPWNANVMLELGYRMATSKPLIVISPDVTLPFDLRNHRAVIVPADVLKMTDEQIGDKVDELIQKISERTKHDLGWGDLHPTATIEVDTRPNVNPDERDHKVGDASDDTAQLYAIPRAALIGMPPDALITRLGELMDPQQHAAFIDEQNRLYGELASNTALARGSRRTVCAEVPMVLTRHPDPSFFLRAYLPAVLSHQQIEHRSLQRVVYIDVSRHVHQDESGVYRVDPPGPNVELLFERYAESYDAVLPELPNYRASVDEHCQLLAPGEGRKILDLGAGTGNITVRLLQAGASVTAVDSSHQMLRLLKTKCRAHARRLHDVRRDGCDLSAFPAGEFDAVNVHLVLFSVGDPRSMLTGAVRVLRPGGVLVITEPNKRFDMEAQLAAAEHHLQGEGRLDAVRDHWDLVKKVNTAFRTVLKEGWRAEKIESELGFLDVDDVSASSAYDGHCTTIVATKRGAR